MNHWSVKGVMLFSFLIALLLSFFPLPIPVRQWWPEWLLLLLIFWSIHHPQVFSIWSAFILGLIVDTITGSTLAMHAITYALVVYLARFWGQNYPNWTKFSQYLFVILLLLIATLSRLFLLLFAGLAFSPYWVYIQIIVSTVLVWPLLQWTLAHKQRQF